MLLDSHVVFSIQFDNKRFETKRIFTFPSLPKLTCATFFRVKINLILFEEINIEFKIQVFPFSILMDSSLNINQMGEHVMKVFPSNAHLIGRPLDEVFRLIRPDIHVEWDKVYLIVLLTTIIFIFRFFPMVDILCF